MWRSRVSVAAQRVRRCSSASVKSQSVLAIRREDQSVWERRAPLAPQHVGQLVRQGVKVLVQPSNRRAFPMQSYVSAGAVEKEDISEANLIIGVKQVPIDLLIPNKTYIFFSHTIKAQPGNMAMLDAILEKNIALIDYEKMVNDKGARVVAFGKYAGVAGMINILHGLGLRFLALGHHTPFMHIGLAHNYRNSEMARQAIRDAGYEISLGLLPKSIGPLIFVFTGSGNVSQGAQEVFRELPYEYVEPEHLKKVANHGAMNRIYACVASREDHFINKETRKFDSVEYEEHPERYISTFSQKLASYATCIINGIYWAPNSPKLLTIPDAKRLLRPSHQPWLPTSPGCPVLPHRLLGICDISADPGGSIEFMRDCTTIDKPFCLYDADENTNTESFGGDGVLVCSIDNMPTQLPREATEFFGSLLLPYVPEMLKLHADAPFSSCESNPVVKNAVIAANGQLTPNFKYIADLREQRANRQSVWTSCQQLEHPTEGSELKSRSAMSKMKKALILGAGYVSGPVVQYLTKEGNIAVTVASSVKSEADALAARYKNTSPVLLDVKRSKEDLERLVDAHDVVVSLLPYELHPMVCELCIKHQTDMVTTSYVSPAMQQLEQGAIAAGITVMNETGLDPGIDHMLAMQIFDEVREKGGKISSFVSFCGGLPAPEHADNPLMYKFSWNPRGVLLTTINGAKYLENGQVHEIPTGGELMHLGPKITKVDFLEGFNLEGYPNRDSLTYRKLYGIESAHTVLRGTLRYRGFCHRITGLLRLGLINSQPHTSLHPQGPDITWKQFICNLIGQNSEILTENLKQILKEKMGLSTTQIITLEQMDLLSDKQILKKENPFDTLCHYLSKRLVYGPGERDLVVLRHAVGIEWSPDKFEHRHVEMVCYGDSNGQTAMSRTVGLPAAIATRMILDGEIQDKGLLLPIKRDIYQPILKRLAAEGIKATEGSKFFE